MRFLSLILAFFLLSACQHFDFFSKDKVTKTPQYHFEKAKRYKDKQNYSEALNQLFFIRKSFFDSSYQEKALLMTADIHFEQKKYPLAITRYTKHQTLYGKQAYVLYKISMAYKKQLPKRSDHDLSLTHKALSSLEELLSLNSSYQAEALNMKKEILNKKREKEFKSILFFEKLGWNKAGLKRAERLLSLNPSPKLKPQILLASIRMAEKSGQDSSLFQKELLEKHPEEAKSLERFLKKPAFFEQLKRKIL